MSSFASILNIDNQLPELLINLLFPNANAKEATSFHSNALNLLNNEKNLPKFVELLYSKFSNLVVPENKEPKNEGKI